VLVHSPLVGPFTWSLVAEELGARGLSVAVPTLTEDQRTPYWHRHAQAVADQVAGAGSPLVLVGHSGACPLLPAIGMAIGGAVSAYVLVDGDLPLAPRRVKGCSPITELSGALREDQRNSLVVVT
jgi:alpha-beta hydrolase superfamily lysophospholipase